MASKSTLLAGFGGLSDEEHAGAIPAGFGWLRDEVTTEDAHTAALHSNELEPFLLKPESHMHGNVIEAITLCYTSSPTEWIGRCTLIWLSIISWPKVLTLCRSSYTSIRLEWKYTRSEMTMDPMQPRKSLLCDLCGWLTGHDETGDEMCDTCHYICICADCSRVNRYGKLLCDLCICDEDLPIPRRLMRHIRWSVCDAMDQFTLQGKYFIVRRYAFDKTFNDWELCRLCWDGWRKQPYVRKLNMERSHVNDGDHERYGGFLTVSSAQSQ